MEQKTKEQELVYKIAREVDGKVRESYSGRGMFSDTCMGIVCDNATECIEVAGKLGLRGSKTDSMGLSVIVYWESIPALEDDEEDEEELLDCGYSDKEEKQIEDEEEIEFEQEDVCPRI